MGGPNQWIIRVKGLNIHLSLLDKSGRVSPGDVLTDLGWMTPQPVALRLTRTWCSLLRRTGGKQVSNPAALPYVRRSLQ